jgi:molybdopterin converting factor subunit 1
MKLKVSYFAWLREHAGADEEHVETQAPTPGDLWRELEARHHFHADTRSLRVAVNDEFAGWDDALSEGDRVVFIPPVAGG